MKEHRPGVMLRECVQSRPTNFSGCAHFGEEEYRPGGRVWGDWGGREGARE